jgi:hypothetical protein
LCFVVFALFPANVFPLAAAQHGGAGAGSAGAAADAMVCPGVFCTLKQGKYSCVVLAGKRSMDERMTGAAVVAPRTVLDAAVFLDAWFAAGTQH